MKNNREEKGNRFMAEIFPSAFNLRDAEIADIPFISLWQGG